VTFDLLLDIIHKPELANWTERNETAFDTLFGSLAGRYPGRAKASLTVRAPGFKPDSGVPFAAYIHPSNASSGPYSGLSFVVFPVGDRPALIGMVVGTQGLAPDEAILGRPGHARKTQAIAAWLNRTYGKRDFLAWSKQDPTRTDIPIPESVVRVWPEYRSVFDRYGREMYTIYRPNEDRLGTEAAIAAFLDVLLEERGYQPIAGAQDDATEIRAKWFDHLMPVVETQSLADLLANRRYVILQGPPGTGKTMTATKILLEQYQGRGRSIQFHPNTTYENFVGGLAPIHSADAIGLRFAPAAGMLMEAAAEESIKFRALGRLLLRLRPKGWIPIPECCLQTAIEYLRARLQYQMGTLLGPLHLL
jgi:5-methylcytosine-specific restriction enzyme B